MKHGRIKLNSNCFPKLAPQQLRILQALWSGSATAEEVSIQTNLPLTSVKTQLGRMFDAELVFHDGEKQNRNKWDKRCQSTYVYSSTPANSRRIFIKDMLGELAEQYGVGTTAKDWITFLIGEEIVSAEDIRRAIGNISSSNS